MDAVVQQAFREVHRGDAESSFLYGQGHDELVTGSPIRIGDVETRLSEPRGEIVGVQRRELAHALHAVAAEHESVGQGAQENARIAHEGRQPADAVRGFRPSITFGGLFDDWAGQVGRQQFSGSDRTGAGSAAAMGCRERLVQVEVQHIEAHVGRLHLAQDRIQVGAVVVQQTPCVVNDGGDLLYAPFEQAAGGRVRGHESRRRRSYRGFEGLDIDIPVGSDRYLSDHAAAH